MEGVISFVCLSVCREITGVNQLPHFKCNCHQTATEWLSTRAKERMFGISCNLHFIGIFLPSVDLLSWQCCFVQLLIHFRCNFPEIFTELWSPSAAAHNFFCVSVILWRVIYMCCLFLALLLCSTFL